MVNEDGELLSIDEGDIFGKRKYILNMNSDWCRISCDKVLVDKVINYFIENKEMLKIKVKEVMIKYDFDKSKEFNERIDNYKDIVDYEWDIY